MKKVRLSERDLTRIVKRVIRENKQEDLNEWFFNEKTLKDFKEDIDEVFERGGKEWDFFSEPKQTLRMMVEAVRDVCDKYDM